jgi:uncharacterized protein
MDHVPPRPDTLHPAPSVPGPADAPRGVAALPPATWRWWEALGIYLLAFLLAGFATVPVIQAIDSQDLATMVASFVAAIVLLGAIVLWLRRVHPGWRAIIGARVLSGKEIALVVGSGVLLYLGAVFVVGSVLYTVISALSGEPVKTPEQVPQGLSAAGIAVTVIYGLIVAPIGEEFFFRGVLFRSIRDRHGFWLGALGSGLAFGLIHYIPGPAPNAILLMGVMVFTGMGLAWIYERRGTILAPMLAHMTFNVIGLALIYSLR